MSGFIFQAYVAGGLKAFSFIDEDPEQTTSMRALVALVQGAAVHHEEYDQDIVIEPPTELPHGGIALIQVKFSDKGAASIISPSELKEISKSFKRAAKRVRDEGKTVSGMWLVSNRRIPVRLSTKLRTSEKTLLRKVRPLPEQRVAAWEKAMTLFSQQFGQSEDQISIGTKALVGTIFQQSQQPQGQHEVSREDLWRCLAGGTQARSLVRKHVLPSMRDELSAFRGQADIRLVSRLRLEEAIAETANRALVIFEGRGGAGKTAALDYWAGSILGDQNPALPFVAMEKGNMLSAGWGDSLVSKWNPAVLHPQPEETCRRLRIANPNLGTPLLHLGLDAIDDEHVMSIEVRQRLRNLLHQFLALDGDCQARGRSPEIRMVVTCRSYRDLRNKMLGDNPYALPAAEQSHSVYSFGDFTLLELQDVAQRSVTKDVFDLIFGQSAPESDALPATGSALMSNTWPPNFQTDAWGALPRPISSVASAPVPHDFVKILQDPVMWQAFSELTEPLQRAWLTGDLSLRSRLGERYVERFLLKASRRLPFDPDVMRTALRRVATRVSPLGEVFYEHVTWIEACVTSFGEYQASTLMQEALSGGLILRGDDGRWQWRNKIVEEYLLLPEGPNHGR